MTGISHLFRKRPKRREPVVLEATVMVDQSPGVVALVILTGSGATPPVHLCEGESIHLTLTEILP